MSNFVNQPSLPTCLREAMIDISDVSKLSEAELESLGPKAKALVLQIEDLAWELAMLAEMNDFATRVCL